MIISIMAVTGESFFRLIVSVVMFILVLGACYMTTVWIGNFQKKKVANANIEIMEMHALANGKYMEIVRVGKKYYLLAVSKDRVEKIDTLEESDIEISETSQYGVNETFSQVFEKLKKKRHQEDKE